MHTLRAGPRTWHWSGSSCSPRSSRLWACAPEWSRVDWARHNVSIRPSTLIKFAAGPNSVDDKDQRNKAREDVFREHGHMLHESTKVEDRDQNGEKRTPHANPEVEGHELHIGTHSHVIHHEGVSQERTGRSEDGQGLPCEGGEDHARDGCRHNHLQHSELAIGAVQEAASEGDGGRQSCDEEVENGRQRFLEVLRLERIRPVARVKRQPPTQVQPQASSNPPSKLQGPVILLGRVVDIAGLIADHCLGLGHGCDAQKGLRWGGCSGFEPLRGLHRYTCHALAPAWYLLCKAFRLESCSGNAAKPHTRPPFPHPVHEVLQGSSEVFEPVAASVWGLGFSGASTLNFQNRRFSVEAYKVLECFEMF